MAQEQKFSVDWKRFRAISLMDVLQRLGHVPVRTTSKEAWFLSPLRSETNASFKVSLVNYPTHGRADELDFKPE